MDIDKLIRNLESMNEEYKNDHTLIEQSIISDICIIAIQGLKMQQKKIDEYANALVEITGKVNSIVEILNKVE